MLGVLYFLAAVSAGEFLRPMYDPVQRTISELAVGRYGYLQISAFVALGLSLVALSVGLWQRLATLTSRLGLVLILVCGASSFVAAAFPTDLRNAAVATVSGEIHADLGERGLRLPHHRRCCCSRGTSAAMRRGDPSISHRRDSRWSACAMLLTMAVTGNSDVAGLLQRIMATTLLLWVALAGVHVGRLSLAARPARAAERPDWTP